MWALDKQNTDAAILLLKYGFVREDGYLDTWPVREALAAQYQPKPIETIAIPTDSDYHLVGLTEAELEAHTLSMQPDDRAMSASGKSRKSFHSEYSEGKISQSSTKSIFQAIKAAEAAADAAAAKAAEKEKAEAYKLQGMRQSNGGLGHVDEAEEVPEYKEETMTADEKEAKLTAAEALVTETCNVNITAVVSR